MANGNDAGADGRKIFVGGLSWETTESDLRQYFTKFGVVSECTLKTDPESGRSRGFGFVLFEDGSTVEAVLAESNHNLHGRTIDPKRAVARGAAGGAKGGAATKKIFVGGVNPSTTEETIKSHFEQFGPVEEVALPFDKMKGTRKGFVFVTFQNADTVDLVVEAGKQTIDGKDCDVRKATPKDQQGGRGGFGGRGRGGGFGRGGGGGGWGGYGQGGGYDGYNQGGWGGQGGYGGGYGGYGGGYDYSGGYGSYNQGYDQGGYGGYSNYGSGGYGGGYGGDSYGSYNGAAGGTGGKQKQDGASHGYHPYQR